MQAIKYPLVFDHEHYTKILGDKTITSRDVAITHWAMKGRHVKQPIRKPPIHHMCVVSIFKNETMNLKCWLDHYIWQGISHFFLIDNGSIDDPLKILQHYIDLGIVTYVSAPAKHLQLRHIKNTIIEHKVLDYAKWIIICDLDEFFYGSSKKLCNVIDTYDNYDVVYCNWLMFGSSGLTKHVSDIRTALTKRDEIPGKLGKYIFKSESLTNFNHLGVHILGNYLMSNPNSDPISLSFCAGYKGIVVNDAIRLNHYIIQSLEYFTKVKMTRGDVNTETLDNLRDAAYFKSFDTKATTTDETLKNIIQKKTY